MKPIYLIILLATVSLSCRSNKNMSSANSEKKESGKWINLFNGKTTRGWHTYGQAEADNKTWEVKNGELHTIVGGKSTGHEGYSKDLVTNEEFTDFHLKLDWKISSGGNSGIIFYVQEDSSKYKQTYETGLEMQILDNDKHSDGKIIKHRAGDLYDLIASSSEPVKPVGEWNTAEIISKNNKLELILNGIKVVSTTLWDDNYRAMLAKSKFKNMKNFGTFKSGKIALQNHGDEVWFRNISIKKL